MKTLLAVFCLLVLNETVHSIRDLEHLLVGSLKKLDPSKLHINDSMIDEIVENVSNVVSNTDQTGFPGIPETVVHFHNGAENIKVDELQLNKILLKKELLGRKIVAVSIVGLFHKGKSFLMDFFLRYLYFTYKSANLMSQHRSQLSENWIGLPDEPLRGFSWKDGKKRHTTGIVLWSDVFLHDADNGEKFAIVLIDTQGLFDHNTMSEINYKIFSFTTLISSIQIYNLPSQLHEAELQNLQFATEYANFSMVNESIGKPFGHLLFLIRDWNRTENYAFGFIGGERYLNEHIFKIEKSQRNNVIEMRRFIAESYDLTSCFLMPHPGENIKNKTIERSLSHLDQTFVDQLKDLVPRLLSPEYLKAKKINGKDATVSEFLLNFKIIAKVFESNKNLSPQSIYESNEQIFMNRLVQECTNFYWTEGLRKIENLTDFVELEKSHLRNKRKSLNMFNSEPKIGSHEHITIYHRLLNTKIDEKYEELKVKLAKKFENKAVEEKLKQDESFDIRSRQLEKKIDQIGQTPQNTMNRALELLVSAMQDWVSGKFLLVPSEKFKRD